MLGRVRMTRPPRRHGRQAAAVGGGSTFTPGSAACLNMPSLPGCLPGGSQQPVVAYGGGGGGGMISAPTAVSVPPITVRPYAPCPPSFTKVGCCTCNYTGGPLHGLGALNFSDPKTLLMLAGGAALIWYLMKR